MFNPTIPPIANPPSPLKPFLCPTTNITVISKAEDRTSTANIRGIGYEYFGAFVPRYACVPITYFTNTLASKAPVISAIK